MAGELNQQINLLDNFELNLFPFKHKHLKYVLELHNSRQYVGVNTITTATLPKVGYIAFLGIQPVACGFLRKLEPWYGQIDTLASNAFLGSQIRHRGIKLVVEAIEAEAKKLKLKGLVCHTKDAGIINRALNIGYHIVDEIVIAKPL